MFIPYAPKVAANESAKKRKQRQQEKIDFIKFVEKSLSVELSAYYASKFMIWIFNKSISKKELFENFKGTDNRNNETIKNITKEDIVFIHTLSSIKPQSTQKSSKKNKI